MNSSKNLSFIRRACCALVVGCAAALSACVPRVDIGHSSGVGQPPEDADYALQKLTVEGAEFVPLVKGVGGSQLRPAYPGRELESTNNNLLVPFDLTPAREWWLRSDERVAPTIAHHRGEYIDEDRVVTTCDFCTFTRCLDNSTLFPVTPSFSVTRTPLGGTAGAPQNINLANICQTRQRLELTLTGDETLTLTDLEFSQATVAETQLRVVPAGGPRSFTSPALKSVTGSATPARFFFAVDADNPAAMPGPNQSWSVNFSPGLPARTLQLFAQGGGQPPEPVNFSRVNAVTGCDAGGTLRFDICIRPERHKCAPINGDGKIELTNTAFCPQGRVDATPAYFTDSQFFAPRNRLFWLIEFDGGAPALAPGRELVIRFTF